MVVGFLLLWIFRWKLQVMILGEEEAASLGLTVITVKLAGIFAATILTHLFGGSAGREGAALQLGGSIGNFLGKSYG